MYSKITWYLFKLSSFKYFKNWNYENLDIDSDHQSLWQKKFNKMPAKYPWIDLINKKLIFAIINLNFDMQWNLFLFFKKWIRIDISRQTDIYQQLHILFCFLKITQKPFLRHWTRISTQKNMTVDSISIGT